jgi:hypothetical protein
MKDLTFTVFQKLISILKENKYKFHLHQDYDVIDEKVAYFRHDVDSWPSNALQMARIENEFKVRAIYYFRVKRVSNNEPIIKKIAELGHEIGYHYEDLADAKGDFNRAILNFQKNLEKLRKLYPVRSIAMHGRPLSKWDSRDLWDKYNFEDFGITNETYLSFNYNDILYLTDTSGCWDGNKYNLRDNVKTKYSFNIHTTFDLINHIEKGLLPDKIMLNIHPARWNDNIIKWLIRKYILTLPKYALKKYIKEVRKGSSNV